MRLRADLDSHHFPRRVLVVEPSRSECSRLCSILAAGEMEAFPAGDLVTAVQAVEIFQPDLILSQLRLPTHNGLALVRRIKEEEATRLVPVILYGDRTTTEERTTAHRSGSARPDHRTVRDRRAARSRSRRAQSTPHILDSGTAVSTRPPHRSGQPHRAR